VGVPTLPSRGRRRQGGGRIISSDLAMLSTAIEEASRNGRSIYDQDQPLSNSLNL
jgi:hypothetical protein